MCVPGKRGVGVLAGRSAFAVWFSGGHFARGSSPRRFLSPRGRSHEPLLRSLSSRLLTCQPPKAEMKHLKGRDSLMSPREGEFPHREPQGLSPSILGPRWTGQPTSCQRPHARKQCLMFILHARTYCRLPAQGLQGCCSQVQGQVSACVGAVTEHEWHVELRRAQSSPFTGLEGHLPL